MARKSETYNSEPFGSPKSKEHGGSLIGTILFIILLALTMSLSVALFIAYLTPHVEPSTFGSLTIVGIFAPILYIGVAICLLMWIVMGRWRIAGCVALMLIPGLFRFTDFYNVELHRYVEQKPSSRSFTLMSYNVRGFRNDSSNRAVDGYVEYFSGADVADIVCFQEYALDMPCVERVDSLFNAYHGKVYRRDVVETGDVVLRTYSRYPIIASGAISGEGRGTSQWVDVVIKNDTLRIFNNHLYTMNISSEDSSDIEQGRILQDGERMRSIVDRIAKNSSVRADFVDTLSMVIDNTPYRRVICGDFNDTPMSYVYSTLKQNHVDAFEECGRGYGYTFRPMYGTLRIDYILHSPELETESYVAGDDVLLSDHLPISARIKILPRGAK
ncbi:MAG: endonuclease/exonuclease/phosphatase family protein [Alistipes sp.]|nr:endonuclease/exonuclease/phosphatase family protein [Alistipes sp.]